MNIPFIKKLTIRQNSSTSLSQRRENTPGEGPRSHAVLTRTSLNDSTEIKNYSTGNKPETKRELPSLLSTRTNIRSTSLTRLETRQSVKVHHTNVETERETLAERKDKQDKKFVLWKKLTEIKSSLQKSSSLEGHMAFPSKINVKRVLDCLELLNEADSTFKDLMTLVLSTLKTAVYVNPKMIETYTKMLVVMDNEELKNLLGGKDNTDIPYFSLLASATKELAKQYAWKLQKTKEELTEIQMLERIVTEKEEIIKDLQAEVERRITVEEYKKLFVEIEKITDKFEKSQQENQKLKDKLKELGDVNEDLRKEIAENVDQIEALSYKSSELECDKENLQLELEKYQRKIKEMQESLTSFKDFKDKIIMKLGIVKVHVLNLRKENDRLINENKNLNMKAGIGFENLTPRPDFKKLQQINGIELGIVDKEGNIRFPSTEQIVEDLIGSANLAGPKINEPVIREKVMSAKKIVPKKEEKRKQKSTVTLKTLTKIKDLKTIKNISSAQKSKTQRDRENSIENIKQDSLAALKFHTQNSEDFTMSTPKKFSIQDDGAWTESFPTRRDFDSSHIEPLYPSKHNVLIRSVSVSRTGMKAEPLAERLQNNFGESAMELTKDLVSYVVDTTKLIDKFCQKS